MSGGATYKGMIRNLDRGDQLTFQYNPESISWSRDVNFSTLTTAGLSYPTIQSVGGDVIEYSFELFFYNDPPTGVIMAARRFFANAMPDDHNRGVPARAPLLMLVYGRHIRKGVITSIDWLDERMGKNGTPVQSRVSIRFMGVDT